MVWPSKVKEVLLSSHLSLLSVTPAVWILSKAVVSLISCSYWLFPKIRMSSIKRSKPAELSRMVLIFSWKYSGALKLMPDVWCWARASLFAVIRPRDWIGFQLSDVTWHRLTMTILWNLGMYVIKILKNRYSEIKLSTICYIWFQCFYWNIADKSNCYTEWNG